jgi:hypothetical protein
MGLIFVRIAPLQRPVSTSIEMPANGSSPPKEYAPIALGGFLDVILEHAGRLISNGYSALGLSGTTAQRPLRSDPAWPFLTMGRAAFAVGGILPFFDTTLNKWILWDEPSQLWRDAITLAVA